MHALYSCFFFSLLLIELLFSKKEDWNALVRQKTLIKDPIGSTRNSLTRRDRRSLRRQILEEVNHGLKMNTQRIVGKDIHL